jgi:hypothetical protein
VNTLSWPFCEVASILSADLRSNIMTKRGLHLNTRSHTTQLFEGNPLTLDVTAPDFSAYLYVDYYRSDGTVIHLYPSNHKNSKPVAASSQMTVGANAANWTIRKPYGNNQIVVIASDTPLFDRARPAQEPAQEYLATLHKQIVVNQTPVTAAYLMVTTNPKS